MSASKRQPIHWQSFTILLLPLALEAFWPILRVERFTPRQLIYSGDFVPFLLDPWSWPGETSAVLTRFIEAALSLRLPSSAFFPCYGLWILIGLTRTLCGFVLTRSVGWAYPRLFNHYALYETTGGLGPAFIAYLGLTGARMWTDALPKSFSRAQEDRGSVVVFVACALLCWISGAPWTYVLSIVCMLSIAFFRSLLSRISRTHFHNPLSLEPEQTPLPSTRLRAVFQTACICLVIIPQPALLRSLLTKSALIPPMPYSPYPHNPLLEIVILSHPRPNDAAAILASTPTPAPAPLGKRKQHLAILPPTSILFTTISSYLPFLTSEHESPVRLSVFTHTVVHPAFHQAQGWLSQDSIPQHTNITVEFYTDADAHPEAQTGQYLHLAEALRWAHGGAGSSGHAHAVAEWVMVVEDDFALCGKWGWGGIVNVMKELEAGRTVVDGKETLARWGGFVGTGGRYAGSWLSTANLANPRFGC